MQKMPSGVLEHQSADQLGLEHLAICHRLEGLGNRHGQLLEMHIHDAGYQLLFFDLCEFVPQIRLLQV